MTTADRARRYADAVPGAAEGGRDAAAFELACRLVERFDLSDETLVGLLRGWSARCDPPLPERTLRTKLASARRTTSYQAGLANGEPARQRPEPEPPAAPLPSEEELVAARELLLTGAGKAREAREWLESRGIDPATCGWGIARRLTEDDLRTFRLPASALGVRLLVPVRAADGTLLDVRRYAAGPLGAGVAAEAKLLPWAAGTGSAAPYGWDQLDEDWIVWCEGEADCETLRGAGLPAVTNTCGAGSAAKVAREALPAELVSGRRFVLLFDHDDAGAAGAAKLGQALLARGAEVSIARWPDGAPAGYDAGDWYQDGGDVDALRAVLDAAELVTAPEAPPPGMVVSQPDEFCEPGRFRNDDIGNGERFAALRGSAFRYCWDWQRWLAWDGTRWAPDQTGRALAAAQEVARSILLEAHAGGAAEVAKHAVKSAGKDRLAAMLALAQTHLAVLSTALDADPWLLNCTNGTIDLRTGELLPHRQADLITRSCTSPYDPAAENDDWARVLLDSTGADGDHAGYLQRACGYSIIGDPREEVVFLAHGVERTGKSTFLGTIRHHLGDYAGQVDFSAFLRKREDSELRPELARCQGLRFVVSSETDAGKRMAEGLLKALSGGEPITTAAKYRDPVSWLPQFSLWWQCNHRPIVAADDGAMWRRLREVPFPYQVPEEAVDEGLKARLREQAGPAVLAYLVQGCIEYQLHGLGSCAAVEQATAAYREEMDPLGPWWSDVWTYDGERPDLFTTSKEVWESYNEWLRDQGEEKGVSRRRMALYVSEIAGPTSVARVDGRNARGWAGLIRGGVTL